MLCLRFIVCSIRVRRYEAMCLINDDLNRLVDFYNLRDSGFANMWDLVFYLEKEGKLNMDNKMDLGKFANKLQDTRAKKMLLGEQADGILVCDVCIWNAMGEEGKGICGQIEKKCRVYEQGRTSCKFVIILYQDNDDSRMVSVYTCPGNDLIEVAPLLQGGPLPKLHEDIPLKDLDGLCDDIQRAVDKLKERDDLEHFQQLRYRQQTPNV